MDEIFKTLLEKYPLVLQVYFNGTWNFSFRDELWDPPQVTDILNIESFEMMEKCMQVL